jgi:signal recognition particle receptor subunit alpha
MRSLFLKLFEPILTSFVASLHAVAAPSATNSLQPLGPHLTFRKAFRGWDTVFDKLLRGLTEKASIERRTRLRNPPSVHDPASLNGLPEGIPTSSPLTMITDSYPRTHS